MVSSVYRFVASRGQNIQYFSNKENFTVNNTNLCRIMMRHLSCDSLEAPEPESADVLHYLTIYKVDNFSTI